MVSAMRIPKSSALATVWAQPGRWPPAARLSSGATRLHAAMRDLRSAGLAAAPSVKTSPERHLGPSNQPGGNWMLTSLRSARWT
eukprot:10436618-Alexandrium_andersonii.AAC.1